FRKIFTKPQFSNFKRLVSGHILSDKKNIQEINAIYGDKDQSSLNRFVTNSVFNLEEIDNIRLQVAVKKLGSKKDGLIILDDTMAVKTGRKMEKANYHRSGVTKEKEWGHCFVDSVYAEQDSNILYPIKISSYLRKVDADKENPFKTKREIALEQIDFAKSNGVKAETVIADSWYYSEDLVKELKSRYLKYFLGVKSNLKISVNRKKRITIAEYVNSLVANDFERFELNGKAYYLHAKEVNVRGDGRETLLVSYKEGDEKNIKCYVTNHNNWSHLKYMKVLVKRWSIESFHRDTKQHLGLEEYQVRKYRGMQVVALAILAAYTLLILNAFARLSAQKSTGWIRRKFNNLIEGRRILNQLVLVKNAKV
ncbi:IS701 family transposase, partial [Candidatus Woesearchaeota archaeon]|nr:IS701 family transposase [Candidatus Woesearchaeota archaeon]